MLFGDEDAKLLSLATTTFVDDVCTTLATNEPTQIPNMLNDAEKINFSGENRAASFRLHRYLQCFRLARRRQT